MEISLRLYCVIHDVFHRSVCFDVHLLVMSNKLKKKHDKDVGGHLVICPTVSHQSKTHKTSRNLFS